MHKQKADLILHPVRMRLLAALGGRHMTAQQLVRALPDIAQTTLYRHLNYLVEEDLLVVVGEHRVRGTVERIYAMAPAAGRLTPADLVTATKEDHLNYFAFYVTALLGDFVRYVQAETPAHMAAEPVLYTKGTVWMSDTERDEFQAAAQALLLPLFSRPATAERRAYLFATAFFPDVGQALADAPDSPE